jgi:hypothetical protein
MDIKSLYQTQERVQFQYFRDGEFWYKTESGFAFPVPLADLGSATLNAEDKATLFVRYIRKHLDTLAKAKQECAAAA